MTIADFAVSAVIFSEVYNEHLNGGHHYRHPAKEIMESKHNVKKYIEHFDGDPDNVTIFGESAGSMSVLYLMVSPLTKVSFKDFVP